MSEVITRFPPSPTGYFHIGSARTALFNYLFAAKNGGEMFLRFEDTDKERSKKEFEDDIVAGLLWLNIPYATPDIRRQSERTEVYKKYFKTLLDKGTAYEAEGSKEHPEKKVVRFKNPGGTIQFIDLIRGDVSFDVTELGDFVIAKNIDEPLYHLAVVIDDYEMKVTHVIRGEDHISNTPRQILILEALGFPRPQYAHIPLILASDRSKMSKRHGATSLQEYRAQGFLPEALVNYLALLGWNPGTEQELFSLQELSKAFSIEKIQKAGAIFDIGKLRWFNHEHMKRLPPEEFLTRLHTFTNEIQKEIPEYVQRYLPALVPLLRERAQTFTDIIQLIEKEELSFLQENISYPKELLLQEANADENTIQRHLTDLEKLLSEISENDFFTSKIKDDVMPYANREGRSAVLWPLRIALSGKERSPDPFTIASLIGKKQTLSRIASAHALILQE